MVAADHLNPQQFSPETQQGKGRTPMFDPDHRMTPEEAEHYFWTVPRTEPTPRGWKHSLRRLLTIED